MHGYITLEGVRIGKMKYFSYKFTIVMHMSHKFFIITLKCSNSTELLSTMSRDMASELLEPVVDSLMQDLPPMVVV